MRFIKRSFTFLVVILAAYLSIGYLFHLVIFPEEKPDVSNYFKPGYIFNSKWEGFKQSVIKQENGRVYCKVEISPNAEGPPLHIHTGFDEIFKVDSGEATILINGETKKIKAGAKLVIPKNTPHKPFNRTDEPVILIMDESAFPEDFAVYLSQVYGYFDESDANRRLPRVIFQMAMFNQYFDSYLAEGPPVIVQKIQNFLIIPLARLLGYRSFYRKYRIKR